MLVTASTSSRGTAARWRWKQKQRQDLRRAPMLQRGAAADARRHKPEFDKRRLQLIVHPFFPSMHLQKCAPLRFCASSEIRTQPPQTPPKAKRRSDLRNGLEFTVFQNHGSPVALGRKGVLHTTCRTWTCSHTAPDRCKTESDDHHSLPPIPRRHSGAFQGAGSHCCLYSG